MLQVCDCVKLSQVLRSGRYNIGKTQSKSKQGHLYLEIKFILKITPHHTTTYSTNDAWAKLFIISV